MKLQQGPRNLYGRDGKFRARFFVPLSIAWCRQIDLPKSELNTELYIFCCTGRQKCTKLHTFSKHFREWHSRPPITGEGAPQIPPLGARPPSHFFRASAAAAEPQAWQTEFGRYLAVDYSSLVHVYVVWRRICVRWKDCCTEVPISRRSINNNAPYSTSPASSDTVPSVHLLYLLIVLFIHLQIVLYLYLGLFHHRHVAVTVMYAIVDLWTDQVVSSIVQNHLHRGPIKNKTPNSCP